MKAARRVLLMSILLAVALAIPGCASMWHELQPHRLHRLNRGPGMPTGAEAYSVVSAEIMPLA